MSISNLFRPRWKHSDSAIRLAAVRGLTDMAVLAEIARADKDPAVRRAALENRYFSHPDTLKDVAQHDSDAFVRLAAVEQLANKSVLAQLADADPSDDVRQAARRKLEGVPSDEVAAIRTREAAKREMAMARIAGDPGKMAAAKMARETVNAALAAVFNAMKQKPSDSLKGLGSDPEILTDTAWRLTEELIVLSLHWADRQAFEILGPDGRSAFMDELCASTSSCLAEVSCVLSWAQSKKLQLPDAQRGWAPPSLGPLYTRRQRQYGACAEFVASPDAPAKGTVFWEAATSLADDLFPGEAMAFAYLHAAIAFSLAGIRDDVRVLLVGLLSAP